RERDLAVSAWQGCGGLLSVVKDDAKAHSCAGGHRADPMSHDDPVGAARARDGALSGRKNDPGALLNRDRMSARLSAGALFDQKEFAAGVVDLPAAKGEDDLQRKRELTVQILMQAVVSSGPVAQQQRRRTPLTSGVTTAEKGVKAGGIMKACFQ